MVDKNTALILWYDQQGIEDVPLTGGKNASLGEMYRLLTPKGVMIPNGFATTALAYNRFIEANNLRPKIADILKDLDTKDMHNLADRGQRCRQAILEGDFPEDFKKELLASYRDLCGAYNKDRSDIDVAIRSSATAEDLPDASFAGQQETFLNIKGDAAVLEACKKCYASLFTNRAISYRHDKKFDQFSVALSIGVQKMVRSDLATSGVMFSIDTETGFKDAAFITAIYGLGENIVQGAVNPDEYYVFKPTLRQGFKPIIKKKMGEKSMRMVYTHEGTKSVKNISVPQEERDRFALSDEEILTLAKWAVIIEDHYSEKAGHFKPMDMEWAKDGLLNQLFIVQARPETVQSQKDVNVLETYVLKEKGKVISRGKSVGERIGSGQANIIRDVHNIDNFKAGQVLVTEMTDPDWEPIMKIASAIVTNRGGRTCHAAIISRELGIPCVVGCNDATEKVPNGSKITVDCSQGEDGFIYEGIIKFEINKLNLSDIPTTKTKVMMNIGDPDQAFAQSRLPNDGVGLAREEFIVTEFIKVHPQALLNYGNIKDPRLKKQIDDLTKGYGEREKVRFYEDRLSQGMAMISAAFYPKDVIVRLSDFKTNEYAGLIGGTDYEPKEDNPMIGWRGSSRYYDPKFRDVFGMECRALKRVRDEMGLKNLKVMIPMCRTLEEGRLVQAEMAKHGLKRGENELQIYVMCEVPSNVILADKFCDLFDGFSIGSNDLTQFTLAVDRDSELVAHVYDERNDAVKSLIASVIHTAKLRHRKIGICGQAPSDKPDFAEWLVEQGIDSISLNPDTVLKTRLLIAKKEQSLNR